MKTTAVKKSETFVKAVTHASFASDAVADASVTSGSLPAGSVYYNTTSSKLKIKEGTSWKTITTS